MGFFSGARSIRDLTAEEVKSVESYYGSPEIIDTSRGVVDDLDLPAGEFDDKHGSCVIVATSDTHRYLYIKEDSADIAFTNNQVYHAVNAYPIGATDGSLPHQGLR